MDEYQEMLAAQKGEDEAEHDERVRLRVAVINAHARIRCLEAAMKLAVDALSRIEAHRTTDMYWASGVARDAIAHVQARAVMPDNAESDGALAHPTRTPG